MIFPNKYVNENTKYKKIHWKMIFPVISVDFLPIRGGMLYVGK